MPFWLLPRTATTGTTYYVPVTAATTATSTVYDVWPTATTTSMWIDQTAAVNAATVHLVRPQQMTAAQAAQHHMLQQQYLVAAQQAAYERYQFQLDIRVHQPTDSIVWEPSRPAILTRQDEARRECEAYRRAVAEHNEQETARILRLIELREQSEEARRQALQQSQERARIEMEQRRAAAMRANQLLLEHLSPAQRDTFVRNGWFIVQGGRSKTRYRIRSGTLVANIDVLHNDAVIHRLCGHVRPDRAVPMGDHLLAQKVMLELAEDDFLRLANRHAA